MDSPLSEAEAICPSPRIPLAHTRSTSMIGPGSAPRPVGMSVEVRAMLLFSSNGTKRSTQMHPGIAANV